MDFIPNHNISWQRIKIAKYITTTFVYHSTSNLFNDAGLYSSVQLQSRSTFSHPLYDSMNNYQVEQSGDVAINYLDVLLT